MQAQEMESSVSKMAERLAESEAQRNALAQQSNVRLHTGGGIEVVTKAREEVGVKRQMRAVDTSPCLLKACLLFCVNLFERELQKGSRSLKPLACRCRSCTAATPALQRKIGSCAPSWLSCGPLSRAR